MSLIHNLNRFEIFDLMLKVGLLGLGEWGNYIFECITHERCVSGCGRREEQKQPRIARDSVLKARYKIDGRD